MRRGVPRREEKRAIRSSCWRILSSICRRSQGVIVGSDVTSMGSDRRDWGLEVMIRR